MYVMRCLSKLWKPIVVGFVVSGATVFYPSEIAFAQTRAAVAESASIPALPNVPESLTFSSEVAGRRALIAARNALRNAPVTGCAVQIVVSVGTEPSKATRTTPYTETLKAELGKGLFALASESAVGKTKTVRRAVSAEGNLVVTRFEDKGNPKNPPVREFTRTSVDEAMPLARILPATGFDASNIVSQWLLSETLPTLRFGTLWRGADMTEGKASYATLYEWGSDTDEKSRRTVIQARRYLLEPKTNRLIRFEEWEHVRTPSSNARANRGSETRITYRREAYSSWVVGKQPYPASAYSQDFPDTYVEKPLARRVNPQPALPSDTDPKALPVLERWREAQERWVALDMQVEQTMRRTPRESQPQTTATNAVGRFGVQIRRYGKTRITQEWESGSMGRFLRNALFISDGEQLRATNRDNGRVGSVRLDSPDELLRQLTRSGFADWGEGLEWIFTNPPNKARLGYYTRIAYEGSTTTDTGEAVEVVLLERQNSSDWRGQVREETSTVRVAIGADGMPRWLESRTETKIPGILEREVPPPLTVFTRYRNIRTDQEPSRFAFVVSAQK